MLRAMLFPAPAAPAFPAAHVTTTERYPRYEDCTQDGRLITTAIPPALASLWESALARDPGVRNARRAGVLPLLTRMTVSSLDAPIRVNHPVQSTVGFELAHARDAAGAADKLFMNCWAEVRGVPGRHDGSHSSKQPVLAGHAFAEHTFTRPFAPAGERKVTSLAGIEGYPDLPEARHAQLALATAGDAPAGASWLDALAPDVIATAFTLDHTDANQHVNSLVYVRCFLDALQRRLAAGGHPRKLRSKAFDIAYRKPSFAGESLRVHLRLFAHGELLGGAGFLAADGDDKPRCFVRAAFGA
jgi:hypothetical protein